MSTGSKTPPKESVKCENLEQRLQEVPLPGTPCVTGNVEVVRTFYTYRETPESEIRIWYSDWEFGFHEGLPQRVADLCATHVTVEVPLAWGGYPRIEFSVWSWEKEGKGRPILMIEAIMKVIYHEDYEEWRATLPEVLTQWKLTFPKGESSGIMTPGLACESVGPSRTWAG